MDKKPFSDSRWRDEPKPKDAACCSCVHYAGFGKCKAFPKKIPYELLLSVEIKHDKPYSGDNGFRYEPIEEVLK